MKFLRKNKLNLIMALCACFQIQPRSNSIQIHSFLAQPQKLFAEITNSFQRLKKYALDQWSQKYNSFTKQKNPIKNEKVSYFLEALDLGRIDELFKDTRHPNLIVAEAAFSMLKRYWPWPRTYSFLIPNLDNNPQESKFIKEFNFDFMQTAERDLIVRKDYIAKYTDKKSFRKILECTKKCLDIIHEIPIDGLTNEIDHLRQQVINNGKNTVISDNICLAIAEQIHNHLTTKLIHAVKYAPTLQEATEALHAMQDYVSQKIKEGPAQSGSFFWFDEKGIMFPAFLL